MTRSAASAVDSRWAMLTVVRPSASFGQRAGERPLGLGVDRRGRLVEDQQPRVGELGPCQRDELALADRQPLAALADRRSSEPVGQAVHPPARDRATRTRLDDLGRRSRRADRTGCSRRSVVSNRKPSWGTSRTAWRPRSIATPRGGRCRRCVIAAGGRVGQTGQQLRHGRLARAGLADDGDVDPGRRGPGRRRGAPVGPARTRTRRRGRRPPARRAGSVDAGHRLDHVDRLRRAGSGPCATRRARSGSGRAPHRSRRPAAR